jgi:hypothetical protein
MKRPKPSHSPPLRTYTPPDLAALLPRGDTDADDSKRAGWMRNITAAVLELMRFGPAPKPATRPVEDIDPRLARIGIRQAPPSDARRDAYNGSSTYLPSS